MIFVKYDFFWWVKWWLNGSQKRKKGADDNRGKVFHEFMSDSYFVKTSEEEKTGSQTQKTRKQPFLLTIESRNLIVALF